MTLKELYYEIAKRVDEDITINFDGTMDDDTKELIDKFLSSINYFYRKVAKDKRLFLWKESVELNNGILDISLLEKEFCELLRIESEAGDKIKYLEINNSNIKCETDAKNVIVYYYYLPTRLQNLSDSPQFPNDVDDNILCFYAAYDYLNIEGENEDRIKAQSQLILLNDALDGIKKRNGPSKYVKEV